MKDFEFYVKLERDYEIKLIPENDKAPRHTWDCCKLEKAFRNAFNIAKAHRTKVKIILRPQNCKDLLFLEAFEISPDGILFDKTQNISLDYIKQDLTHGNNRFLLPLT